eukprot:6274323-Prymnesium_polylepis.1
MCALERSAFGARIPAAPLLRRLSRVPSGSLLARWVDLSSRGRDLAISFCKRDGRQICGAGALAGP